MKSEVIHIDKLQFCLQCYRFTSENKGGDKEKKKRKLTERQTERCPLCQSVYVVPLYIDQARFRFHSRGCFCSSCSSHLDDEGDIPNNKE